LPRSACATTSSASADPWEKLFAPALAGKLPVAPGEDVDGFLAKFGRTLSRHHFVTPRGCGARSLMTIGTEHKAGMELCLSAHHAAKS